MSTKHRKSKFAIPGVTPCCGRDPRGHNHVKEAPAPVKKRPAKAKARPAKTYPVRGARPAAKAGGRS